MERDLLVGVMGLVFLFVAVSTAADGVQRRLLRRTGAAAPGDSAVRAWCIWHVRNGFRGLYPLADALLGNGRIAQRMELAVALCASRGTLTNERNLLSAVLAFVIALGIALGVLTRSVICALAVAACVLAVASMAVSAAGERRRQAVFEQLPDVLATLSSCFGAGFTLLQTFAQVANEVEGPLAASFSQAAHVLETGGSAHEALTVLRDGSYSRELAFVLVALEIQHQSGGSMKQVIGAVSDTVKGELALKRSLRVQTAQAKLSARIVAVMPLILVALFSLASPGYLMPFFTSAAGMALFALAVVLQMAGIALVKRALSVGGVS